MPFPLMRWVTKTLHYSAPTTASAHQSHFGNHWGFTRQNRSSPRIFGGNNCFQKAARLEFRKGKNTSPLFILKCLTLVHWGIATKLLLQFVIYETVRHFYINNGLDNSRSVNTMIHHHHHNSPTPRFPSTRFWDLCCINGCTRQDPTFNKADGWLCISLITVITAALQPVELWTSVIPAWLHVYA